MRAPLSPDLMEAAGLEKSGIYRHSDTKEQLAREAFDHAWKLVTEARFDGIDDIPNRVDRLRQFLRNFKERPLGLVPGGRPLLNTAIESGDANPQLRDKARYALRSSLDRLESIVEEGQRKAEISSHIDAAEIATLIVSTLEGNIMVSRLERKSHPIALACRHLEEYLEANVRAQRPKCQPSALKTDFRERAKNSDVPIARLIGFEVTRVENGRATVLLSA